MSGGVRPGMGARFVALLALLFIALAVIASWPLALHLGDATPSPHADSRLTTWIVAWEAHALPRSPTGVFDAPHFAPRPNTLAYSEHMLGIGVLAAPLVWATGNPYLAHNVVLILAIAGSALAAAVLAGELTGSRTAAVVGGVAFGFAPYWANHLMHVQLLASGWIPLAVFGVVRWIRQGRTGWLVLASGAALMASLTSWYQAAFVAVAMLVTGAVLAGFHRPARPARMALHGLAAVVALGAALVPFAEPYRENRAADPEYARSLEEVERFSARPGWYLAAPSRSILYGYATASWRSATAEEERTLFPGIAITALAVFGALAARGASPGGVWVAIGLIVAGVLLAAGAADTGPRSLMPLALGRRALPALEGIRAASRGHVLTVLGLAILAAFGARAAIGRIAGRPRPIAVALATAVVFLEGLAVPIRLGPAPEPTQAHARISGAATVLEIPMRLPSAPARESQALAADAMLASTGRWYRLVNGYAGFEPAGYDGVIADSERLPEPDALEALRARGIDVIVVRQDLASRAGRANLADRLAGLPGVTVIVRDTRTVVLDIRDFESPSRPE